MSKKSTNSFWVILVIIAIVFLFVFSFGSISSDNINIPKELKDSREEAEKKHKLIEEKLTEKIDFEEKAFYDKLKTLAHKYDFEYPEDKLIHLAKEVKTALDDKAKYTDWSKRDDIKAELKVDLIILLAENDYPPVDRDEVYKEIFEQAENFKKNK